MFLPLKDVADEGAAEMDLKATDGEVAAAVLVPGSQLTVKDAPVVKGKKVTGKASAAAVKEKKVTGKQASKITGKESLAAAVGEEKVTGKALAVEVKEKR